MATVTPQFRLFSESIPWPKGPEGKPADLTEFIHTLEQSLDKLKAGDPIDFKYKPDFSALPVGLRWTMLPEFGFPRQPFRVYRRVRKYSMDKLVSNKVAISGAASFPFVENMYVLEVQVSLTSGQTLVLEPRDRNGKALPGIRRVMTSSGIAVFQSPFIASLQVIGFGTLNYVLGVPTDQVLNANDWQLIQIVGLPFPKATTTAYSPELQGFVSSPTHPDLAALQRLLLGYFIMPAAPDLGALPLSTPAWAPPDPDKYVQYLTQDSSSLLFDIQKCLEICDDSSWNPMDRQPAYIAQRTVSGVHQTGVAPTTAGSARFPVLGSALLQVSSDSFGALALGYGTYDFANFIDQTGVGRSPWYDYKVETEYLLRPSQEIFLPDLFDGFSEKHTFAALSEGMPLPADPVEVRERTLRQNRPESRDADASEAVKISWQKPELPEAWGLVVSRKAGQAEWLNTENFFSEKSYQPYLTRDPQNEVPGDDTGRFHYIDPESAIPPYGDTQVRYFLAGLDVFGRWSAFREVLHTGHALPPKRPIINSIKLVLPDPDLFPPPSPAQVTCQLEIEFSWEWSDRRAAQIQFSGQFFTARTTPPAAAPAGFSTHSSNAAHPLVTISFDLNGNPTGSDLGTVVRLDDVPPDSIPLPPSPGLVQYRLIIPALTAVFPSGDPHAVAYAAYVRGLERLRVPVLEYSPWSPPATTEMPDPRKPAVVHLPAEVQFAALPDATKKARGRLSWATATNALGYHVWEASETALRFYLDNYLKNKFPEDESQWLLPLNETHVARATQLRDLLVQQEYEQICAKAFNRYNRDVLTQTFVELELAGSSGVLTVFRISSVNRSNIESEKSGPVFFAVPKLNRPAAPNLSLKPNGTGIEVQVIGNNPASTAGYRVYRTRKTPLSNDVGAKGLPVFLENDAAWQAFTTRLLNGPTLSGQKVLDPIATRSWKPLYYQVTAIGTEELSQGRYAAESAGSPTRQTYFPPETAPTLVITTPVALPVLHLETDLPFHSVAMGKALIELFKTETIAGAGVVKTAIQQWTADALPTGMPPAPRLENVLTSGTGTTTFDLVLPAEIVSGMVRVTDPLGRSSSIVFS